MSDREDVGAAEPFRVAKLGRHSLVYGAGLFLSKAVAFIMLPIYTRWLTPADYGALQLITMTFEFVAIVAGARMALGVFHYYHKASDDRGRNLSVSTAHLLLGAMYVVTAVGTAFAAPWIAEFAFEGVPDASTLIRLAATSMVFEGLILVPMSLLQLQNRSGTFVLVNLARLCLQVLCNLIFLIPLGMGVEGVMWGSVTTHMIVGSVLTMGLLRSVGGRFDLVAAREYLRFGVPLIAMSLAAYFTAFGDRYFLNRAGTTADVGLYGLAYQFGFMVLAVGGGPFLSVWTPQRFAIAKRPDRDEVFARVFVYFSVALVTVSLGIVLLAGDVLRLIAAPAFQGAAAFVPFLVAAYAFQTWSEFLNLGIYISERTVYSAIAHWLSAVVALGGFLYLIPMWLTWGAAVTTLLSLGVRCWLMHVFSQRLWPIRYRWGPVVWISVLATLVAAVSTTAPVLPILLSITFHSSLVLVFALVAWVLPVLSATEKETFKNVALTQGARIRTLVAVARANG